MSSARLLYGLGVHSNRPLAALESLQPARRVDVSVELGGWPDEIDAAWKLSSRPLHASAEAGRRGTPVVQVRTSADGFHWFEYDDGVEAAVDPEGARIWMRWPASSTPEDAATYLLGPLMAFVLRLRGITSLHASAVTSGKWAFALCGPSGAGKSTSAAAFAQQGLRVLTDDVCALRPTPSGFEVQAAYPRVRLWPESAELLFGARDALPPLTPTWDKRFMDLNDIEAFEPGGRPLGAVYLLSRAAGRDPKVIPLESGDALLHLVPNTHSNYLHDAGRRAAEFADLARLVADTPVYKVQAPDCPASIPDTCRLIREHFDSRHKP